MKTYRKPKVTTLDHILRAEILVTSNAKFEIETGDGGNVAESPKRRVTFNNFQ